MNTVPALAATIAVGVTAAIAAPAAAQVTFHMGNVVGTPGQTVDVPVFVDSPQNIEGWSFGVELDAPATIAGLALGADALALNSGAGPDFVNNTVVSANTATAGVVVDIFSVEELAAGAALEIGVVQVAIPASAQLNDVYTLDFSSMIGSPPTATVYVVNGVALAPMLGSGSVTVVPAPASAALFAGMGLVALRRRRQPLR